MGRATAGLAAFALASCSSGGGGDTIIPAAHTQQPDDAAATASAVTLTGRWPLTGRALDQDAPEHPVYVVKIDNTSASAPQFGLSSADMIVEELVEGGLTRLTVFFYSDIPAKAGPVRSMRASDVGIVQPAAATLVASGGARPTLRVLAAHDVTTMTEHDGAPGFYRDDSDTPPYNLYTRLSGPAATPAGTWAAPSTSYLPFGGADAFAGNVPVSSIDATFSGSHTTSWRYSDDGWRRPDSFAQTGDDFAADNVLLLRVKIGDAGYRDAAGSSVPETLFYGTGEAVLVHGDSAVRCSWNKADRASPLTLSTDDGTEVTVPPGRTWIELVPSDTGGVTLRK